MNTTGYRETAEYCRKFWPEETAHIIRIANEVCEKKFLFDLPWDMERTSEMKSFPEKIDWYCRMNDDPEFLYQLNRHRFFIVLGQAYHLTGDEKYAESFAYLMNDWIDRVPCPGKTGEHPWRSLEVGLRGEYWTKAMAYFADCPVVTDELRAKYKSCLELHAKMLRETHTPYHKQSNWGIIQDHGLFAIGAETQNLSDINLALERLTEQAGMQVMDDGVHWEQSCMYHNEVLSCFLDVIIRSRRHGIEVPDFILQQARKMAHVNLKWIKPDGRQPLFGDSDDTCIRDMLTVTAYLFEDEQLKSAAYEILDFESVWLLGTDAAAEYEKRPSKHPDYTSVSLEDSGTHILRSGWGTDANFLCMHNGYTGGGHAHSDKLHFDLSIHGEDVLVDSGRYTYKATKERTYLKGTAGHNITTVDHRRFIIPQGWGYRKLAPSVKQGPVLKDRIELLQGGHLGYARLIGGVYSSRKILWIKPDIYIIFDEFTTKGAHSYQQLFHFSRGGRVELHANQAVYTGKKVRAELCFFAPQGRMKLKKSLYSPGYNQIEENVMVQNSFIGVWNTCAATVIYGAEKDAYESFAAQKVSVKAMRENIKLPSSFAQALAIKKGTDEYTVILSHTELYGPLLANGKIGTGKLTVFINDDPPIVLW